MAENNGNNGLDESSPLLVVPSGGPTVVLPGETTTTTDASPSSINTNPENQQLWEELEQPWPSTYGRSIALLASPIQTPTQVDLYTKSPKPGSTPAALARRRDLRRGFYTPSPKATFLQSFGGRGKESSAHDDDDDNDNRRQGLDKVHSLDFKQKFQTPQMLDETAKKQQQKAKAAKEYRDKILKQQPDGGGGTKGKKDLHGGAGAGDSDGKSTFAQCAFNLANILMGVGLLGLPFSFRSAGWIGGFFCLGVFGAITWRTSILIGRELNGDPRPSHYFVDSPFKSPLPPGSAAAQARMYPPITTFPDIARVSFGESGCFVLSVVLYFELFSCIAIFFVAIGDHLHQLFPDIPASIHATFAAAASLLPTMVLRTPALLSYLSMVGTFATIAVVASVAAEAMLEGDISENVAEQFSIPDAEPYHIWWNNDGLALSFGLVAYCFSGHAIVPSIYSSMKKPQDFEKMVTWTFLVVGLTCVVVAASGYYMFGSTVLDQITLSLERSSKAASAMKALTWLMILTAFSKTTLTMFPLALGMEELVAPYLTSDRYVSLVSATIKLVLTVLAVLVAIFVPSFSLLCALVGMICTMTVSVIFPAAAHTKMFGARLSTFEKFLDASFVVVGIVMAIAGTIVTI